MPVSGNRCASQDGPRFDDRVRPPCCRSDEAARPRPNVAQLRCIGILLQTLFQRRFVNGISGLREYAAQHRLEETERQEFGFGVECAAVVTGAEFFGLGEISAAAERVPHVAVHADMVEEEVTLEDAVMPNHPM